MTVPLNDLTEDMILAEDVKSVSGAVVVPKGQGVSVTLLVRLQNFQTFHRIQEPITVWVPAITLQDELT